jgi:hypothetical protein
MEEDIGDSNGSPHYESGNVTAGPVNSKTRAMGRATGTISKAPVRISAKALTRGSRKILYRASNKAQFLGKKLA